MSKKKIIKKEPLIPPEEKYVSLTNHMTNLDPNGGAPTHRYECMGCNKTESMVGYRQAEDSIYKKSQSHRCEKYLAGEEDYPDRGRKDL